MYFGGIFLPQKRVMDDWALRLIRTKNMGITTGENMKRIVGLLVLFAFLVVPSLAFAERRSGGIYIAPKFVYSATWMNRFGLEDGSTFLENRQKTDSNLGGALAVGYDFGRRFRVEVEGAMFSKATGEEPVFGGEYMYKLITSAPSEDDINVGMKQELKIKTAFVNAYYDFRNEDVPFSFWIGAGIGMAFIENRGNFSLYVPDGNTVPFLGGSSYFESWAAGSEKKRNIAWNVGLGVGYDFNDTVTLDIGYRFSSLGQVKTAECPGALWFANPNGKINNVFMHQLLVGLRFTF